MMDLKEKLNLVFNSGRSFIIQNVVKRIDGEWEERIIWEEVQLPGNRVISSCEWNGFEDIEDCADDILKYMQNDH